MSYFINLSVGQLKNNISEKKCNRNEKARWMTDTKLNDRKKKTKIYDLEEDL